MEKILSESLEDYLREIYMMEEIGERARVTDIASIMGCSKASVNKAVNSLKSLDYLEHEHYGQIKLTESGREVAREIVDTYKVTYKFLTDVLEIGKAEAVREAHRIEHILGKGTRKKLKKHVKKHKK